MTQLTPFAALAVFLATLSLRTHWATAAAWEDGLSCGAGAAAAAATILGVDPQAAVESIALQESEGEPASLQAIAGALGDNGLHTRVIRCTTAELLSHPGVYILHLACLPATSTPTGPHFLAVQTFSDGTPPIFLDPTIPIRLWRRLDSRSVFPAWTGAAIVVSTIPLQLDDRSKPPMAAYPPAVVGASGIIAALVGLAIGGRVRRWRAVAR